MDPKITERLAVTVEEASSALGISRSRAYEIIKRGQIPTIKLGGRLLVPWSQLTALIERKSLESNLPNEINPGGDHE